MWHSNNPFRRLRRPSLLQSQLPRGRLSRRLGFRLLRGQTLGLVGLGRIGERRFMLVGHRKGRTTKERLRCNFGCAHPEGYRKALRLMKMAERFGLPVLTLIDTAGAWPGIDAESRGQSEAIARNLIEMAELKVPIICTVIGEGGSGGALALGVGDRTVMLEYAVYSTITPEGCASILWKDAGKAKDAAEQPVRELDELDDRLPRLDVVRHAHVQLRLELLPLAR